MTADVNLVGGPSFEAKLKQELTDRVAVVKTELKDLYKKSKELENELQRISLALKTL